MLRRSGFASRSYQIAGDEDVTLETALKRRQPSVAPVLKDPYGEPRSR
jgi:hypothetical protein